MFSATLVYFSKFCEILAVKYYWYESGYYSFAPGEQENSELSSFEFDTYYCGCSTQQRQDLAKTEHYLAVTEETEETETFECCIVTFLLVLRRCCLFFT